MSKPRKHVMDMETIKKVGGKPFMRYTEAAAYFSMGVDSLKALAKEADAVYRIGGIVLVNVDEISEYLKYFKDRD